MTDDQIANIRAANAERRKDWEITRHNNIAAMTHDQIELLLLQLEYFRASAEAYERGALSTGDKLLTEAYKVAPNEWWNKR
jgi:hypothetical protein